MLICCPLSDKMVLSVVSACLIADYLCPNFLWKLFALYLPLSVSFISTSLAQLYCMVYTALPFASPINENNQRRICNMCLHMHLDLYLAAFYHFYIFECYHFCLTRFGLVFMILFWTSSQFLIHIGECRLSYYINKNFSNLLQLFIVFF